jgi:hypothetical protein
VPDYDMTWNVIARQVLDQIKKSQPKVTQVELESIIADIRIETTVDGASTLEIDLIDPDWLLLTSGFLNVDDKNKLNAVDINYPRKSSFWWRLTQVSPTTETSGGANLTLTFEDRVVSYLRQHKGAKSWSRRHYTRAQALKAMVDEVKAAPRPVFVSPELTVKQPVASS